MKEMMRRWLGYLFVFLLPFQTVWIFREIFISGVKWQYGTIAFFASEVVLFIWLLCFLPCKGEVPSFTTVARERRGKRGGEVLRFLRNNTQKIIVSLFFVWITGSLFWAYDRALAFSDVCIFLLGAGLFLMMQRTKIAVRKMAVVCVCALCVHACIGIGQFLAQESLASSILGITAHIPNDPGTSVLKMETGRVLRAYGGMAHPNVLGGALSVGLILVLWLWITALSRSGRMLLPIGAGILLFALLLSFSRTAWAGFFLGSVFFFTWMLLKKKEWNARTIPIAVLMLVMGIAFGGALYTTVSERFSSKAIVMEGSVRDRMQLIRDAFSVWKENPIAGVGLGNETLAVMERDFGEGVLSRPDVPVWEYQPVHNIFLLALAETGLIGLGLLLGIFFFLARAMVRAWKETNIRRIAFAASLLALVPATLLDHWLWTSHFGVLLVSFLVGLFVYQKKE